LEKTNMAYEPNYESLRTHPLPAWFDDAKFGIMITWGPYSVPAWAEVKGDLNEIVAREGWQAQFRHNPYAEWYLNTIRIDGSPAQAHHRATYGADFRYEDFAPIFNRESQKWNPSAWGDLFKRAGAQYAVLITKHCDTFALWDTAFVTTTIPHPYHASRDLVGAYCDAMRAVGIAPGLYYCAGMDWVYNPKVLTDFPDVFSSIPQTPEFVARCRAHWRELIERYRPPIMWGDIGYPVDPTLPELMAYYYNTVPDGVINDRFAQTIRQDKPVDDALILSPEPPHFDFRTPEYTSYDAIPPYKWECVRGIGHSFGYNAVEDEDDYIQPDALIAMLVDIVSKNGNLLLGVGPAADGTIPALQVDRLEKLGAWLDVNGEAIYGTRPHTRAEGTTREGLSVRFTRKGDTLYAIPLGTPVGALTLGDVRVPDGGSVRMLGYSEALAWTSDGYALTITLPDRVGFAPVIRIG
jgi:alpha-L-fucosidase